MWVRVWGCGWCGGRVKGEEGKRRGEKNGSAPTSNNKQHQNTNNNNNKQTTTTTNENLNELTSDFDTAFDDRFACGRTLVPAPTVIVPIVSTVTVDTWLENGMVLGRRIRMAAVVLAGLVVMYLYSTTPHSPHSRHVTRPSPHHLRIRHGVDGHAKRSSLSKLSHLVLVAGHAVYDGPNFGAAMEEEEGWTLLDYQKGQLPAILAHIPAGVAAAARDGEAMLVFSGGATRSAAGPRSEAASYWYAADAAGWFGEESVADRAFLEPFARDSFENLFFAVCRFREITGAYPQRITVVSFEFKRKRFVDLHRAALGFPRQCFDFIGTPLPSAEQEGVDLDAHTRQAFASDPYGCIPGGELFQKKFDRNPQLYHLPYPTGCPELSDLFSTCSSSVVPSSRLPWGASSSTWCS